MKNWKDITGYENLYQVSECGAVRVLDRIRGNRHGKILYKGRELKAAKNKKGYWYVNLCANGSQKTEYVHILVGSAFVDGKKQGMEINHKDCDKSNNNHWNLEWVTHLDNQRHASKNGRMSKIKKYNSLNGGQNKKL